MIDNWGIAINILLGVCIPIFLLLDDLLYKPIELIGWKVASHDNSATSIKGNSDTEKVKK